MRTFLRKKTQGIVLLSCLIFLLLMLTLLRFVLSSAQMGEFKSGADYDELTAKEAVMLVMRDAEMDIMRTNVDGYHIDVNGSSPTTGPKEDEIKLMTKAVDYWLGDGWRSRVGKGVFDGDGDGNGNGFTLPLACKDKPLYLCDDIINWSPDNDECGTEKNQTVCYGGAKTGASMQVVAVDNAGNIKGIREHKLEENNTKKRGRYIIERFAGKGQVLGFTAGADQKIVVLRVTAIGFSQPADPDVAVSSAMLQNTYVISKRDE